MGNVSGKESHYSGSNGNQSSGSSMSTTAFTREFLSTSIEGRKNGCAPVSQRKKEREQEKFKIKTKQIMDLVVKYDENVDGGYLAPYGNYKYELDYMTETVRKLIIKRKLAPFFTPLEDFSDDWDDGTLLTYLSDNLKIHQDIKAGDLKDEYEDPTEHKLHISNSALKRKANKIKIGKIKEKAVEAQTCESKRFEKDFRLSKKDPRKYPNIPSNDLLLRLYKNSEECPICFLYYPKLLNKTRCCAQPICTECFVQMKRTEPHFPHDDTEDQREGENVEEKDPDKLISEAVKCPFCAVDNFGVVYTPPKDFKTGIEGSCRPGEFKFIDDIAEEGGEGYNYDSEYDENNGSNDGDDDSELTEIDLVDPFSKKKLKHEMKDKKKHAKEHRRNVSSVSASTSHDGRIGKRRASIPVDAVGVITVDLIRPDWEQKLLAARTKMARRSAAATALHATSLLSSDGPGDGRHNRNHHLGYGQIPGSSRGGNRNYRQEQQLEEMLIEEAMRLSLLDEEERRLRERMKDSS